MSTVFVIGAGASHGERLGLLRDRPPQFLDLLPHPPPLTRGFFDVDLLNRLHFRGAEQEFSRVINHIRAARLLNDPFGERGWRKLDLEEIFTALEIEREFENPESDLGAELLLVRNDLVRYIRRVIALCTQYAYGEYYSALRDALGPNDTIITFNWDLLLDQRFVDPSGRLVGQYSKFFASVKPADMNLHEFSESFYGDGLFLKLHGSLNWYRCGNRKCQASKDVTFVPDTQRCLSVCTGIADVPCGQCGSEMSSVIVPPLLRKPITEDSVIRSAWGLAWRKLREASRVVVIGFSAAPTDFYAAWLLRSTIGVRKSVRVDVINPSNKRGSSGHEEFRQRMLSIFLQDYDFTLNDFSQIDEVLR